MELLKFFIKDEVPAVGLTKFKEEKEDYHIAQPLRLNINRQVFKPNYSNNFFLM